MIYSYLVHNINLPNWNKLSDHTMNHFKRRIGTFSAASIVKQNQLKVAKPASTKLSCLDTGVDIFLGPILIFSLK